MWNISIFQDLRPHLNVRRLRVRRLCLVLVGPSGSLLRSRFATEQTALRALPPSPDLMQVHRSVS